MSKPVILTGLRANNDLHLGNYLGALLPMVDMANKHASKYQINLFVPDLHSFTTPIDHNALQGQITQNLKAFVAAGLDLDNPDIFIYRQSFIPAHSELTIILNGFTGFGEMNRMTQFKDKSIKLGHSRVSVGLFGYPVLMSADILLYGASYVPVGDDQTQHLEFARDIAQRLNKQFDELFVVPKPVDEQRQFFAKDQGIRIRDLADPTKKMSKSGDTDKGIIFLTDTPEAAKQKIISAATDSVGLVKYDLNKQPGISNLLQILALLENRPINTVVKKYEGQKTYGPLKQDTAEAIAEFLSNFQKKLAGVNEAKLMDKLTTSETAMSKVANQTLLRVQKAVGLR